MKTTETNMEHFRSEILEIVKDSSSIAVVGGIPKSCKGQNCDFCDFDGFNCEKSQILWMMEEYRLEPMLTVAERHFLECMEIGYIARDEDGLLCWFGEEPIRQGDLWDKPDIDTEYATLNDGIFDFITWKGGMWETEDLMKLKVKVQE